MTYHYSAIPQFQELINFPLYNSINTKSYNEHLQIQVILMLLYQLSESAALVTTRAIYKAGHRKGVTYITSFTNIRTGVQKSHRRIFTVLNRKMD